MENYNYLYTLNNIIYTFASLCIIVAGITLFYKRRTLSTTLMLVGSIVAFLFTIGSLFISSYVGRYDTETFIKINAICSLIGGLAYVVFCGGLMLFAITDYKKDVPKNEFLDD